MGKKEKNIIESIKNNNDAYSQEQIKWIKKKISIKSFIGFLVLFLISFFSIVFYNKYYNLVFFEQRYFIYSVIGFMFVFLFHFIYSSFYSTENKSGMKLLKRKYRNYKIIDNFVFFVTIIAMMFFVICFVVTPATVDGPSMNDTLHDKEKILVYHMDGKFKTDDIVVINTSKDYEIASELIIKRIVAGAGDKVEIKHEDIYYNLYVNGKLERKLRMNFDPKTMLTDVLNNMCIYEEGKEVTIPNGYYLVLGDNTNNSADSRYIGLVRHNDILGKCIFRFFPFNVIGYPERKVLN